MSCQPLDDLFQWASQQPAANNVQVNVAMTTNEETRNNLVTYSEGILKYVRGTSLFVPPHFSSDADQIRQYFSDRRTGGGPFGGGCPFDCANTDPLTIIVAKVRPSVVVGGPQPPPYEVTVKSSKYGLQLSFGVNCDPSGIVYGSFSNSFFTLSFCGRQSSLVK